MNLQRTNPADSILDITFHTLKRRLLLLIIVLAAFSLVSFDGKKQATSLQNSATNAYLFKVNKIELPINNVGVLADVPIPGGRQGVYDDKVFLFSGGFFLGGYGGYDSSFLWVNGVASAVRIGDY
ncbi:MAG: hypothetical protein FJ213_10555 [Ignavibacteria bacterium]|nr:hypothetical protein [Ignavibacteria bacterium]